MKAIKSHFDGKTIAVPPDAEGLPPGEVVLIFNDSVESVGRGWLRAQESAFSKIWDNDEDAVYDHL